MKKGLLFLFIVCISSVWSVGAKADVSLSGYIDGAYQYEFKNDITGGVLTGVRANRRFAIDRVKLTGKSSLKDWNGQIDLHFDPAVGSGSGTAVDTDIISQAFINHSIVDNVIFKFGRFFAPIGFEVEDNPDRLQFSNSFIYSLAKPIRFTGVSVVWSPIENLSFDTIFHNGWEENADNTNYNLSWAEKLTWVPLEGLSLGLIYNQTVDSATLRQIKQWDFDVSYESGDLILGGEYNHSMANALAGGQGADWNGFLLVGNYQFIDWFSATLRYEWFNDKNRFRTTGQNTANRKLQSMTAAGLFSFSQSIRGIFEVRYNKSNLSDWASGNKPANNMWALAWEMTYVF